MVTHEATCRRWRACVSMHNLVAPRESCCSSHKLGEYPGGHWQDLTTFISAMKSADLAQKTEALHQLSLFFLYVAPTSESSFTCPDAHTVSVFFQNKSILLALKDIQALHRLLFFELANHSAWLFRQEESASTFPSKLCGSQWDHANLVFIVKVLQCCIYILPLLEFNTGLSLVAAETLVSLLKQLTCPKNIFRFSAKGFDEMVDIYRKQLIKRPCKSNRLEVHCYVENASAHSNVSVPSISSVEASIKGLQEHLCHKDTKTSCFHTFAQNNMVCSLHGIQTHTDRGQIACALLEVFIEELLLQPRLADLLMASDVLDSSRNQLSHNKYVQLTMEAAAMHFLYSISGVDHAEVLQKDLDFTCHGSRTSLPAAVMLFDLSMVDAMHAPDMFLVHIINMLRRSFKTVSCLTAELPGEMVLGLAASALESAATLYLRWWKPYPLPLLHNKLPHGELLNCLSEKFWALCDGNTKKVASVLELLFDQESYREAGQQEHGSFFSCAADATYFGDKTPKCSFHAIQSDCYNSICSGEKQEQLLPTNNNCFSTSATTFHGTSTALLVSVLHLMSTALLCLGAEVDKDNPRSLDWQKVGGQTSVNAEVYISNAKEVFKFCASVDRTKVLEDLKLDKELQKVVLAVDELTGNAFSFFAERLHLSLKQGAPQALCQAYLEVLKSLSTLLVFTEQRRKMPNSVLDGLLCKAPFTSSHDTVIEEEQNIADPCSDGNPHTMNFVSSSLVMQAPFTFSHDTPMEEKQNIADPCSDGNPYTMNFVSSSLVMTKVYQRKRKSIISTKRISQSLPRINGTRLATENEHVDGDLFPQKLPEKDSLQKQKQLTSKLSISKKGNAFIEQVIASEGKVDGECFSDLSDFIVCKEGRDYSRWMKSLYKKRKKKLRKTFWQRIKAKRALVSLLTSRSNDRF